MQARILRLPLEQTDMTVSLKESTKIFQMVKIFQAVGGLIVVLSNEQEHTASCHHMADSHSLVDLHPNKVTTV